MSLKLEVPKEFVIYDESGVPYASLANFVNCLVTAKATAAGKLQIDVPGSQGTLVLGVLQPQQTGTYETTDVVSVRVLGVTKVKAQGAFNSGIELTLYDNTGVVHAASSGDYVVGISREAATAAGHLISMLMTGGYWKA